MNEPTATPHVAGARTVLTMGRQMKRTAKTLPTLITAFTLEAGQKPERDRSLRGALALRDWQRAGLEALRAALFRILLAPTGSGKSTLIKALSALDLAANPRRLAVIAVPQSIIAGSFLRSADGHAT